VALPESRIVDGVHSPTTREVVMKVRWLAAALAVTAIGLAACGDDDGGGGAMTAAPDSEANSPQSGEGGEAILIKTSVTLATSEEPNSVSGGEVLDGSSIGDSPFCPGGTFQDVHSEDHEIGLVDRKFDCPDGRLRIGFSPQEPTSPLTQSGPWQVVACSGSGAFLGLQGDGQMEIKYQPHTRATEGRETFTGTVVQ
jgi:hypothetical protein